MITKLTLFLNVQTCLEQTDTRLSILNIVKIESSLTKVTVDLYEIGFKNLVFLSMKSRTQTLFRTLRKIGRSSSP